VTRPRRLRSFWRCQIQLHHVRDVPFLNGRLLAATGRLDEASRWFSSAPTISDIGPLAVMWRLDCTASQSEWAIVLRRSMTTLCRWYVAARRFVLLPYVAESRRALSAWAAIVD